MKTVLVASDINGFHLAAGGVATFVHHFAHLLRSAGDEVTVCYADNRPRPLAGAWQKRYAADGIRACSVHVDSAVAGLRPDLWQVRLSERVADEVGDADVVYFQDWANHGFSTVRAKRLGMRRAPMCVTVLHGASAYVRTSRVEELYAPDDLQQDFMERYAVQHSDFIASPSRFMLARARQAEWSLPSDERVCVLGLPFRLEDSPLATPAAPPPKRFERIVFYGRLERLKGLELFVDALLALVRRAPRALRGVRIVLLGPDHQPLYERAARFKHSAAAADALRRAGIPVERITALDSDSAQHYLRAHAAATLVVTPSLVDNFPYAAIECTCIPGLNVIGSRAGGVPEILGPTQTFVPHVEALTAELCARLACGPLPADRLTRYDAAAANRRWLEFHARVSAERSDTHSFASGQAVPATPRLLVRIACRGAAPELPRLLTSLARQTCRAFDVVIDADGPAVLERANSWRAGQTAGAEDWTFSGTGARAEYVCLLDAAEVAAPELVERLLTAARVSGDDCFGAYIAVVQDAASPTAPAAPSPAADYVVQPLGDPLAGLLDDATLGEALCVRCTALEAVGGVAAAYDRGILHAKLAAAGYRSDIIPAVLLYREPDEGQASPEAVFKRSEALASLYTRRLHGTGMGALGAALASVNHALQHGAAAKR